MKKFSVVLLYFLLYKCCAQQTENKLSYYLWAGGAYSRFAVGEQKTSDYPTLELRAGSSVNYKFAARWAISTGVNACLKLKRKS